MLRLDTSWQIDHHHRDISVRTNHGKILVVGTPPDLIPMVILEICSKDIHYSWRSIVALEI